MQVPIILFVIKLIAQINLFKQKNKKIKGNLISTFSLKYIYDGLSKQQITVNKECFSWIPYHISKD